MQEKRKAGHVGFSILVCLSVCRSVGPSVCRSEASIVFYCAQLIVYESLGIWMGMGMECGRDGEGDGMSYVSSLSFMSSMSPVSYVSYVSYTISANSKSSKHSVSFVSSVSHVSFVRSLKITKLNKQKDSQKTQHSQN